LALFLKDAHSDYLWQTPKNWRAFFPLVILEKAQKQNFDCPGDFSSLKQMSDSNHIMQNLII
jgi:hypothetical protein